jgi:tetraacyldisaccharide 4'-kinase
VPSGRLREFRSGATRADVIIVTKSPKEISDAQRHQTIAKLNPTQQQRVYFSSIQYKGLRSVFGQKELPLDSLNSTMNIALVTGIANPTPLIDHLKAQNCKIEHQQFPDHHAYSGKDLQTIRKIFDNIAAENKILLTTEKDAVRFMSIATEENWNTLPFYFIEIEVAFHGNDRVQFDEQVLKYVGTGND